MLDWMLEPFTFGFMRNALVAASLTVVATSLIGTWVVLRGITFMGDALAHGVLPGIAVAYLLGGNLVLGGALSAAVMIGGISLASTRTRLSDDTSIGLLFVGMLAAGVAIISKGAAYAGDLTTILFGDPIGVTDGDIAAAAIAAAITVVVTLLGYRPFLALTFSHAKAGLLGMRPGLAHIVMLALVALVVIASFQTVGTLLVFAFIVAPPATGALLARRVPVMMAVSVGCGLLAVVAGLLVSYHAATATAPTIAGTSVLGFFVVLAIRELATVVSRRRTVQSPAAA